MLTSRGMLRGGGDAWWFVCGNERSQTECGKPSMRTKNAPRQIALSAFGVSFHLFCIDFVFLADSKFVEEENV